MKKFFLGLVLFLFPAFVVNANSISNINMDIYVAKDGSATITERWTAEVNSGTEGYHPYFNLGDARISLLSASMDGKEYTIDFNWDINKSLKEKQMKAGIYYTGDEVDICFGLTNYGSHLYEIKYKIDGFVATTTDADMIYWTLMPQNFSAAPSRVHIKIYSDERYSDTLDVWGYGQYGAYAYVYDGYIEMETNGTLLKNQYLTLLAKFPKGTFNTYHKLDNDFNYYYEMAEDGAVHYTDEDNNEFDNAIEIFEIIITVIFSIGLPLAIGIAVAVSANNNNYKFGSRGKKIPKDVPPFRDIPCNKNVFRAYFVANTYRLIRKKEDFLGVLLLKWLKEGNIKVETIEKKKIFKTEKETTITFLNQPSGNIKETELYKYMYEASKDGVLEKNEFKSWCDSHYSKILNWFNEVLNNERDNLVTEGKISVIKETKFKVFKINKYLIDDSMMDEAIQMAGLKKFLKEFTLIKERQPIEVKLWNEYLMYAQIFGIANQVAKQFKKLYPEIITEMNTYGYDLDTILFMNSISNAGVSSANSAKSRAENYSSGGGGFSSGGGGGGSFGGGGGGGGFR